MKKILISIFLKITFFFSTVYSQNITDININVFVLNGPQCNHWYYASVADSVLGTYSINAYDIDTFPQQYIYKFVVPSIIQTLPSSAVFNFCAVTTPPCTCVDACVNTSVGYGGAITLLLCNNTTNITQVDSSTTQLPFRQKFFNSDVLKIVFDPCEVGNEYWVFNTTGTLVQRGVIKTCDFVLDLRNLAFGLYFIRTSKNKVN